MENEAMNFLKILQEDSIYDELYEKSRIYSIELYVVGGACRDFFRGVQAKDFDFSFSFRHLNLKKIKEACSLETSHQIDAIMLDQLHKDDISFLFQILFKGSKQIHKDFPVFQYKGYEFTPFRKDNKRSLGYHGFSIDVTSVSLYDDLKRRDLTMNAIAFSIRESKFIDYFNGKESIELECLYPVSKAFSEDPLRILRSLRFAAEFNFKFSKELLLYIDEISEQEFFALHQDRVKKELVKVINTSSFTRFYKLLCQLDKKSAVRAYIEQFICCEDSNLQNEVSSLEVMMRKSEFLMNHNRTIYTKTVLRLYRFFICFYYSKEKEQRTFLKKQERVSYKLFVDFFKIFKERYSKRIQSSLHIFNHQELLYTMYCFFSSIETEEEKKYVCNIWCALYFNLSCADTYLSQDELEEYMQFFDSIQYEKMNILAYPVKERADVKKRYIQNELMYRFQKLYKRWSLEGKNET